MLYAVVAFLFFAQLWRPSKLGKTEKATRWIMYGAFALHTLMMVLVFRNPLLVALENGADYFLWVSWCLALVCLIGRRWFAHPLLGAFTIPAVVLFMGSSSYLLHQSAQSLLGINQLGRREGVFISMLHGVPALVALVSLVLALVVSAAFLILERRLKHRRFDVLDAGGVSLQLLDSLNKHLVQVGFAAISLVIVSGGVWAIVLQKSILTFDTSVVSGLILWALLAAILHARLIMHWSPKKVSRLTLLVTASYFASLFLAIVFSGRITHASLSMYGGL
jgi:ABC-type transport system involved in cytochrome c biogenesis permease subunit